MILNLVLWLPTRLFKRAVEPVVAMFESLNEAADRLAAMTNEEIDAFFAEQPL